VAALALVWAAGFPPPAQAQFGPDAAQVVLLNGRVSLERAGELWVLDTGDTVRGGQVVVTGPDGYAQLQLSDHSILEVFPNSRLVFRANRFNLRELLELFLGKVRLQIQHLTDGDSPYRVTTPTAVISIRGTVLDVDVGPGQETVVQVETGSVGVRHRLLPGREVVVESGQSIQVLPNLPLAALRGTTPLAIAGRVLRVAGDTLARIPQTTGQASGSPKGSAPSSGGGSPPAASGSDSGSNEPAPAAGRDETSAPPGDAVP
jgi:hypothetical protein